MSWVSIVSIVSIFFALTSAVLWAWSAAIHLPRLLSGFGQLVSRMRDGSIVQSEDPFYAAMKKISCLNALAAACACVSVGGPSDPVSIPLMLMKSIAWLVILAGGIWLTACESRTLQEARLSANCTSLGFVVFDRWKARLTALSLNYPPPRIRSPEFHFSPRLKTCRMRANGVFPLPFQVVEVDEVVDVYTNRTLMSTQFTGTPDPMLDKKATQLMTE
jgi:hypothetical protein